MSAANATNSMMPALKPEPLDGAWRADSGRLRMDRINDGTFYRALANASRGERREAAEMAAKQLVSSALVLPVEAVTREKTGSTVFLITADKKLERRAVTVGTETPTRLEIASGLAEGDLVMVGSRAQYSAGQLVQPKVVELPKMD